MADIIKAFSESSDPVVQAAIRDSKKWMKLKKCKTDLELLLTYNIAHLAFKKTDDVKYTHIICTSNTRLINVYSAKKSADYTKALASKFDGIKTNDSNSIMTYDLIEGKLKTIPLKSWHIVWPDCISISTSNVAILDNIIRNCLHRKQPVK